MFQLNRFTLSNSRNKVLHSSTKLVIFIAKSVLSDEHFTEDLIYHPIWSETQLTAHIHENSPANTWLQTQSGHPFTLRHFLSADTLTSLANSIPNLPESLVFQADNADMFHVEPTTGYVQALQEFDHEKAPQINVTITACIRATSMCFRQRSTLTVSVQNRNDNEPRLRARFARTLSLRHASELMRAMSLFAIDHSDADNEPLVIELERVDVRNKHNCSAVNYINPIEWFSIYSEGAESTVLLTDLGYDTLIHFSSKLSHFNLVECAFTAQLVVKVSDELFANQVILDVIVDFRKDTSPMRDSTQVSRDR